MMTIPRTVSRARGAVCLLAAGVLACADRAPQSGQDPDEAPVRGGTVVIAGPNDFDFLNSLLTANRYTQEMIRFGLFLPLVEYTADLDYQPALAESWEMLGDSGVVFQLRRDVTWHDGVPTSAHDVAFWFERAKDPATAFPNSDYFGAWTDVEVIDSFTVRFRFEPHADPLAGLPFTPVVPKHLLDSIAPAAMRQAAFNKAPVGNGPFRFVEYLANDRWVFEANPAFPEALGGRPYLDRVVYRIVPETASQSVEIRTGNVDLVLAPPAGEFLQLDSLPHVRSIANPARDFSMIGWNGRREPFDDPAVRRALTMAIDRQALIDLRYGFGTISAGPIPPYHWGYPDDVEPLPFAPDRARALLDSAGIRNRDADPTLELENGEEFSIVLKIPANSAFNRDLAELLRSNLSAIGVNVTTAPTEFTTLIGDVTGADRDFDAALLGWEGDFRLNLRNIFHSADRGGPFQFAGYANPAVDSLIDATSLIVERDRARPLLARLQRLVRDDQPWSFLYYYPSLYAINERVRGADMDIRGALVNLPRWWVSGQPTAGPGSDSAVRSPSPDSAPAR